MVSNTSERWSRKEFTDTLRIRASSALHLLKQFSRTWDRHVQEAAGMLWSMCSVSYTDNVLPDTVSSLPMPPFLGSRSGERERRAMTASRDDGKGTSRELQEGQGNLPENIETHQFYFHSLFVQLFSQWVYCEVFKVIVSSHQQSEIFTIIKSWWKNVSKCATYA